MLHASGNSAGEGEESTSPPASASSGVARRQILFVAALVALFAAAVGFMGGLSFPLYDDEVQFWDDTVLFASRWPPDRELLRGYPEPMTPGAFVLWGASEHYLGGGIEGARALNFALAFVTVLVIGLRRGSVTTRAILAACGYLLFPYVIPLSIHLYTDTVAAFFVVLGFWCSSRARPLAGALFFALGIATRQYAVAFPAALVAYYCLEAVRSRDAKRLLPALLPALASATLLLWIWFFGGLAPPAGIDQWPRHAGMVSKIAPGHGLYFLVCTAVYFVIPEFFLFRRWSDLRSLFGPKAAGLAALLMILFLLDSPTDIDPRTPGGAFARASLFLPGFVLAPLYFALALITSVRFFRSGVGAWVVLLNFFLMFMTYVAWEKYYLPVLAALWLLKSSETLEAGVPSNSAGGTEIR